CIVRCELPRAEVADMLPPGLRPSGGRRGAGRRPVVLVFGDHDQSAVLYASLRLPTGVSFHEMVIAIPAVASAGERRPCLFVPRVFSTEPVVTWSGNAHYAYAKRMVRMEWLGGTFVVSDERGGLLAHAVVEPQGRWARTMPEGRAFPAALGRMP